MILETFEDGLSDILMSLMEQSGARCVAHYDRKENRTAHEYLARVDMIMIGANGKKHRVGRATQVFHSGVSDRVAKKHLLMQVVLYLAQLQLYDVHEEHIGLMDGEAGMKAIWNLHSPPDGIKFE